MTTSCLKNKPDNRFQSEFKICDLLPPPLNYERDDIYDNLKPLHIRLVNVQSLNSNVQLKSPLASGKKLAGIQLRLSLCDITHHKFFGRTLSLPETSVSSSDTGNPNVELKQDVYLLQSVSDAVSVIVICIEVIGQLVTLAGTKGGGVKQRTPVSLGWTVIRPFQDPSKDSQQARLYRGTPRALLFLEEPIESNPLMQLIGEDCRLCYVIDHPKRLLKLRRLLPLDVLVADYDSISGSVDGVLHLTKREVGVKLRRSTPLYIDSIRLQLSPSLEVFENELCQAVHCDISGGATSVVKVSERRLRLGVHNEWCYLRTPQIVYLSAGSQRHQHDKHAERSSSTTSRVAPNLTRALSWSPSHFQSPAETVSSRFLFFDGRISLMELREDVDLMVTFAFEYVLTISESSVNVRTTLSPSSTRTLTVLLGGAVWSPHRYEGRADDAIGLPLVGALIHNPERMLVYRNRNGAAAVLGELQLRFDWVAEKRRSTSLNFLSGSRAVPQPPQLANYTQNKSSPLKETLRLHDSFSLIRTENNHMVFVLDSEMEHPGSGVEPSPLKASSKQAKNSYREDNSASQFLNEIPCAQGPQLPIVALNTRSMLDAVPLPRSAYARLYAAGVSPILDRHGHPPDIIDPTLPTPPYLFSKEESDPLQRNLFIFQFLSFTNHTTSTFAKPLTLFFAFQFYCHQPYVTERLLLERSAVNLSGELHQSATQLLRRMKSDGTARQGPAGFEVKYCVDPNSAGSLKLGDFLNDSKLHLDVWDGDSLMFLGNAVVELRDLCRQGREAVQGTFELDVVIAPTIEDEDNISERKHAISTPTHKSMVQGRLLLRMANIGYPYSGVPPNNNALTNNSLSDSESSSTIVVSSVDLPLRNSKTQRKVALAKSLLLDMENDEKSWWLLNCDKNNETNRKKISEETTRKVSRMNIVRSTLGKSTSSNPVSNVPVVTQQRLRNWKAVEAMRERIKNDVIRNHLSNWVGVQHRITPAQGSAEYFEFELMNPLKIEQSVIVEIDDNDLRIIVDSQEWQLFRKLCNRRTQNHTVSNIFEPPIEERMFFNIDQSDSSSPQLLLKPRERVRIPFRYQCFDGSDFTDIVHNLNCIGLDAGTDAKDKQQSLLLSRLCRVHFRGKDSGVFAVLCLTVDVRPPCVDQILRFQNAENSFLKRHVRIWRHHSRQSEQGVANIVCTDQHVTAEILGRAHQDPVDVLLKVPCGGSGSVRSFLLFFYDDIHRIRPAQTCRVTVQSLQRIDVSCITGQITRHSVVLRGGQSTRLVRCYSSMPIELQLQPEGDRSFVLAANDRVELCLMVKSLSEGTRFAYVHVVDVEFRVLLHCWMVCVRCRPPTVTRSFQIRLPLGGGLGSNKRISYRNPYLERRVFLLFTNRPDRLQFRESAFEVAGGCSHVIGLVFLPCSSCVSENLFVFINNEDDINEETFCVKTTYE